MTDVTVVSLKSRNGVWYADTRCDQWNIRSALTKNAAGSGWFAQVTFDGCIQGSGPTKEKAALAAHHAFLKGEREGSED